MRIICLLMYIFLNPIAGFADDINLNLYLKGADDNVTVTIENSSAQKVFIKHVDIDLDNRHYTQLIQYTIQANNSNEYRFKVFLPTKGGSYPLIASVVYLNEGKELSLRNVGIFSFMESTPLDIACATEDVQIVKEGKIVIKSIQPQPWRLVLPNEIEIISAQIHTDKKVFTVNSKVDGFTNRYPFYAIAEDEYNGKHRTAVCRGTLAIDNKYPQISANGRIPSLILLAVSFAFLCSVYYIVTILNRQSRMTMALLKYSSRMFLITISYLILQNINNWGSHLSGYIHWEPIRFIADSILGAYRGENYKYFFQYFIDLYFFSCLVFLYPYLYYCESDTTTEKDKYASLLISILSVIRYVKTREVYWCSESRLGFLTFLVKLFFLPLLTTWVINNTLHQINITKSFHWDYALINAYLVALFIYIDTSIFCFGYLFEFKNLKNEIKSVDPTILGWLVCILCYPPFNTFSFKLFDYQIFDIRYSYPQWTIALVTLMNTALWGVFAWASIALGFKGSNLTNRGIVNHGPYRFVRHPAYAAKLLIWYIQGVILGQFFLGMMMAFTVIYVLRAWTEERHLSMDEKYLEYRRNVRFMFIPGLI
jgi:protein-S-isoprenylcysteine O-methyltransferase Ste14